MSNNSSRLESIKIMRLNIKWCVSDVFCTFIPLEGSSRKPTGFPWNHNFRRVNRVLAALRLQLRL